MCSAKILELLGDANVGVLGFTAKDQTPRAVAVTPYLIDGTPLATTTLALLTKAKMLRNRPAAAMFAGGVHVNGDVSTTMHRDADWFDNNLRELEQRKYPPAKSLFSIPFHRRLLWWYVGRVELKFDNPEVAIKEGTDRTTITSLVDRGVIINPLPDDIPLDDDVIEVGADIPPGAACLLVHHETAGMAELLSMTIRGNVSNGHLTVTNRRGSLEPQNPGTIAQLKGLRGLARLAKSNRTTIDNWDSDSSNLGV